jgi:hypothetical protein
MRSYSSRKLTKYSNAVALTKVLFVNSGKVCSITVPPAAMILISLSIKKFQA